MKVLVGTLLCAFFATAAAQHQPYVGQNARDIGTKIVNAERSLDELFQKQNADQQTLEQAVRQAASLQGEYRLSHVETHRRLRAMPTSDQIAAYDRLRGYEENHKHHGG